MTEHRVRFALPSPARRDQRRINAAMQADVADKPLTWMRSWQGWIWADGIFRGLGLQPHPRGNIALAIRKVNS
jgi:hypothetical protein